MNEKKIKTLLGKRIRQLRKERGLTQASASERAGTISEKRWSDIERGMYAIGLTTLINIASGLNVSIQELFKYKETRSEKFKRDYFKARILELERQTDKMHKQINGLKKSVYGLKRSLE